MLSYGFCYQLYILHNGKLHYYHDKYIKSKKVVGNGNTRYHYSICGVVFLNIKNDKNILLYIRVNVD